MIYPAIAQLVQKTGTRYSLAVLTARRARQLGMQKEGSFSGKYDEAIIEAIEEIDAGKVKAVQSLNSLLESVAAEQK